MMNIYTVIKGNCTVQTKKLYSLKKQKKKTVKFYKFEASLCLLDFSSIPFLPFSLPFLFLSHFYPSPLFHHPCLLLPLCYSEKSDKKSVSSHWKDISTI